MPRHVVPEHETLLLAAHSTRVPVSARSRPSPAPPSPLLPANAMRWAGRPLRRSPTDTAPAVHRSTDRALSVRRLLRPPSFHSGYGLRVLRARSRFRAPSSS
ncbi:Uncharacterized protein FWK35_00004458 [Aphis craccivora]|uniref:Uncharacterized protein n=1 Tax=Aphis craccivora TaxID=307492 RepID=A0A6G0ZG38_APHCR|nr:Uncharacterized protein FWK35_00004458 [Aphis craccivora]